MSTRLLLAVIAEYLDAYDAGAPLDRAQLLAQHPEVANSLGAFFEDHDRLLGQRPQPLHQDASPTQAYRSDLATPSSDASSAATLTSFGQVLLPDPLISANACDAALVAHLLGLISILLTVQITYLIIGTDNDYHLRHTGVLLAWLAVAFILQKLFSQPRLSSGAAAIWCIVDTLFMTTILILADPPIGPLLSGYALLIVASGLLLKTQLVMVTTASVLLCYLVLLGQSPELCTRPHYCVMFALLMLVLGGVVTAQVRRIAKLNRHFENCP